MANYSDIFPLTGGNSTIAGMTSQGTKSADFTAVANSIYEITASCKMTLPSSPSTNDKVGFFLTSTANFDITSTDKFNGSYLATDYVKRVTQLYVIVVLTYSGSTNGWTWDSRDNNFIANQYTGTGIIIPYTSTNTLNGVINYIGTASNTTSYSNPVPSLITVSAASQVSGGVYISGSSGAITDKDTSTSFAVQGVSSTGDNVGVKVSLPTGKLLIPTVIAVYLQDVGSGGFTLSLDGIKNDNSVEQIGSVNVQNLTTQWHLFSYSGTNSFKTLYFHGVYFYYSRPREFEAWGLYIG